MFRFYSNPMQSNRVSVVGQYDNNILSIAVARCSNKDNFIRKKGRMIAEGRLRKGKVFLVRNMVTCSSSDFVNIAKEIIKDVETGELNTKLH